MSKPGKISAKAKKGVCYYGIAASSKVRVGSHGTKDLLLTGAGRQSHRRQRQRRQERQRRQRQRRQAKAEKAKTEKAGKGREGRQRQRRQTKTGKARKTEKAKKQTGIFKNIRILQRQAGSYRTENQLEIRQVGTLDCTVPVSVQPC